ncbi:MAG: 30S ribosomal protein S4 [Nitrospirae bacterium]|nr:30S ribosomal protein S4 [Nitrospirota bacterium]
MARYRDALCRKCRRESEKLFLKGDRCYTDKCGVERRKYPPGQHGQGKGKQSKLSDYGLQLREKQKVKQIYGVLEKQFKRYFYMAKRTKGVTGGNLLQFLEMRLDSMVYHSGFDSNRRQARQFITHGHLTVNGRKVNIPSYLVRVGDVIAVKEPSRDMAPLQESVSKIEHRGVPTWMDVDTKNLSSKVLRLPSRDEIALPVQEELIVELYSR